MLPGQRRFFYVVGRKDNLLKVGGHRVSPQAVEDVLMESGLLVEALVLGIPDPIIGNRLYAIAVPKADNCSAEQIVRFGAQKLPKHEIPSEIRFVQKLPKNSSGKIDRARCLDLYKGLNKEE